MKRILGFLALVVLPGLPVSAQAVFSIKNTDSAALFDYWIVEGNTDISSLAALPLARGGRHTLVSGERATVTLGSGQNLIGVFVPWRASLNFQSVLSGGSILAAEAPVQGTLLLDILSFAAANRGRELTAPLQQWGLEVPRFVLDGHSNDWAGVPILLEWGPVFRPKEGTWPAGWPRPRTLQVIDREGALWLRLILEAVSFPPDGLASLLLRRPGAALEWILNGPETRVWAWTGDSARPVGSRISAGGVFEARIPWDRITEDEKKAWFRVPATWSFAVSTEGSPTYELGSFDAGDLP